jgi:hypothetical protein
MSQVNDRSMTHHGRVSENEPGPAETQPVEPTVQQPARTRWRDRSWSLPVLVVVALVAVLLGGLGGAALASVGGHQDGSRGPGFGRGPGGPGMMPGRGVPGQRGFGQRGFGFNDPYGSRQQNQQQPGAPSGQLRPFGTPSPVPTPSPPA